VKIEEEESYLSSGLMEKDEWRTAYLQLQARIGPILFSKAYFFQEGLRIQIVRKFYPQCIYPTAREKQRVRLSKTILSSDMVN
jgi:hypothetical protein